MICLSVMYPNTPGASFNHEYYQTAHRALVMKELAGSGLLKYETDRGVAGREPGSEAPFVVIARAYFNMIEEFQAAMAAHGATLLGDVPNFTNIQPLLQVSENA